MKTKSGKIGTKKAALSVLIIFLISVQVGFSQLVGFNGILPKKSPFKTKYKCKHVGVQKVKHYKGKRANQEEFAKVMVRPSNATNLMASVKEMTPGMEIIPEIVVTPTEMVEEKKESPIKLKPQPVYFRYDSYRLDIIDLTQIALAVNYVKDGHHVTIIGHTDDWGSEKYNEVLSHKRANIIRDMMIELGCNPDLIEAYGEGEKFPIDTNDHESGRQNNRRVEFIISDKKL